MPNRYSIVAMKPLGTEEVVGALQTGAAVTLVREPHNEFDANAVMVWVDGKHVGYIPKATNQTLARFIDANGKFKVTPAQEQAFDENIRHSETIGRAIEGRFVRSPNSGYPQVEV